MIEYMYYHIATVQSFYGKVVCIQQNVLVYEQLRRQDHCYLFEFKLSSAMIAEKKKNFFDLMYKKLSSVHETVCLTT